MVWAIFGPFYANGKSKSELAVELCYTDTVTYAVQLNSCSIAYRECAEMILRIHKAASSGVLKVTHDKYMQPEFGSVAAIRPLDNLPV